MYWIKNINFKNLLFIVLAVFLVWFIIQIKNIALLAFGSFVLACSFNPAVDKLSEKISRSLASTLVIMLAIIVVVLFLIPVITISIEEVHQVINNIPVLAKNIIDYLSNKTIMGKALIEFIDVDTITGASSKLATGILNKSLDITMALLETITVIITISVIVFYMLNEKFLIRDAIILLFPPKMKERAKEVYENIEKKVGGYVIAQILSMSTVAICTALGLMALNVDYAIMLGLIAGILDIVPIVGPTLALILGVVCAAQHGWLIIILTIVVYLTAQWISNNFIRPLVFGKFLDLHPIIIIFAFLISGQFLGVWGVILSPAIAALLITLFEELYLKTINKNEKMINSDSKQ
ncbi:AI-2E family transporter [bacterium]|nr:AI-2E family transporter [bacterium]